MGTTHTHTPVRPQPQQHTHTHLLGHSHSCAVSQFRSLQVEPCLMIKLLPTVHQNFTLRCLCMTKCNSSTSFYCRGTSAVLWDTYMWPNVNLMCHCKYSVCMVWEGHVYYDWWLLWYIIFVVNWHLTYALSPPVGLADWERPADCQIGQHGGVGDTPGPAHRAAVPPHQEPDSEYN